MQITLNVNNPDAGDPDTELRLINLNDVRPEMTLGELRSRIESEGIPAPAQHIYHNGNLIEENSRTLKDLNISDGDMLALHVRDMRGSTSLASRPQPAGAQRNSAQAPAPAADPELVRLQVLGNPVTRAELERTRPQMAAALEDPQRWAQLFNSSANHEEVERRRRIRAIEALNNDEFNPEAQARIEEIIRQQGVMENIQNALEYNPESFGRVHMLYLDVKVNGVSVKALVDSGAQATVMSPSCAERCNIMHLIDTRYAGIARGVGTANILGRVHYTMLQIGTKYLSAAFTVMEGKSVDLLLGLDILKGHQAIIDLTRNKLVIQGEESEFLGESDIPRETDEALNSEPTIAGPGGTTIGTRSGAVTAPAEATPGPSMPPPNQAHPVPTPNPAPAPAAVTPSIPPPQPQQQQYSSPPPPPRQPQPTQQQQQSRPSIFPEADVQGLIGLGVDRATALHALEAANGNIEIAAGLLFQGY